MGPGFKPAAVSLLALFPQRQGDAETAAVNLLDFADQVLDLVDEFGIAALPALKSHGTIAEFMCKMRAIKHFRIGEAVACHLVISGPEAAVKAVFLTDVSVFDEPPQVHIIVQVGQFHFQPTPKKTLHLVPLRRQQDLDVFTVKFRLAKYVFECCLHDQSKIDKKTQTRDIVMSEKTSKLGAAY